MAASAHSLSLESALAGDPAERAALLDGAHDDPHAILGPHAATVAGVAGTVVRIRHPAATAAEWRQSGRASIAMMPIEGLFAVWLPGEEPAVEYRIFLTFADGSSWEGCDPYRFPPTLGEYDLYLLSEGTHWRLWERLGARPMELDGVRGYGFSVWAPNARRVSVVGGFCHWDGRLFPMRRLGNSGIFDLFLPELGDGELYKYEIVADDGTIELRADPVARFAERPPGTASRTYRSSWSWSDGEWIAARRGRDLRRRPLAIYEVHLGSWLGDGDDGQPRSYRELAPKLVAHVRKLGFNYLQLMPVMEHPFSGSWGYQVSGYFAPTSRHGTPDDLRYLVDTCHRSGIGVILDWVPGHFVRDAHGLGRFDGTALYEHADPRRGLHPDWDTYIFNYSRHEVRGFLIANALYWLDEFHVDGLRVDAVASMLYLDYSRRPGEWIPNDYGGNENLEAIDFLRAFNQVIHERYPGCFTVAEESTAWSGVTRRVADGGLGFDLKWNLGWMHDTLEYFGADPLFRAERHDRLTFAMIYEYSEHFVNPLSHDEVVHGKGSLYGRMPGDPWRKLANLRALFAYLYTRPGKKLLFMGSELAIPGEWDHRTGLAWNLLNDPDREAFFRFLGDLGALYHQHPCLWRCDSDPAGFQWIACHDREQSVFSYERLVADDGEDHLIVVLNLTPVPREDYRLGAPRAGRYRLLLTSDDLRYGGSGYPARVEVDTEDHPADGYPQSMVLTLPPLAALVFQPVGSTGPLSGNSDLHG